MALEMSSCHGRDISGPAAICCVARSRPATESGDLTFAALCLKPLNTNLLAAGDPLDEVKVKPSVVSPLRRRSTSVCD